jgi:hypothetical protein
MPVTVALWLALRIQQASMALLEPRRMLLGDSTTMVFGAMGFCQEVRCCVFEGITTVLIAFAIGIATNIVSSMIRENFDQDAYALCEYVWSSFCFDTNLL